eukprot:CAMPEP_0185546288 /NCGR_PEP_ID=MMETSP1381-20130426/5367_1 /TAXON_ID=298111 /ORGANISM="Pavlova sp., Strain CCMP459" /LENGTH=59 /DNA_ID=CAMNT_0028158707 /DNA_START=444 /DNA_END=620 /DNA_ORIENTATION=+
MCSTHDHNLGRRLLIHTWCGTLGRRLAQWGSATAASLRCAVAESQERGGAAAPWSLTRR